MNKPKLPAGLRLRADGVYYYRSTKEGKRDFVTIGKVSREAAIKQWLKITNQKIAEPATSGTVAEIIDQYLTEELPDRLKHDELSEKTAEGYTTLARSMRAEFGACKYAKTAAQSTDLAVLRTVDLTRYIRKFKGKRGATQANRQIGFLSVVFSYAQSQSICTYNPCIGATRNDEEPRKNLIPPDVFAKFLAVLSPELRLISTLSDLTTLRKTDCRELKLSALTPEAIIIKASKTKRKKLPEQAFARTPAINAVLEEAKKLPGRKISLFVFPNRFGLPYTEDALQKQWGRAKKRAGLEDVKMTFRDIRTTEINAIRRAGGDATAAAGHADKRTTERHYLTEAVKITPRR